MKNSLISRSILIFGLVFGIGVSSLSAMELQPISGRLVDAHKLRDGSYQIIVNKRIVTVSVRGGVAYFPDTKLMGFCASKEIFDRSLISKIKRAQRMPEISKDPVVSKEADSLYNFLNCPGVWETDIPQLYHLNPYFFRHVNEHPDWYRDVVDTTVPNGFNPKIKWFAAHPQRDYLRCGLFATCNAIHFLRAKNEDEACAAFEKDSRLDDRHEDRSFLKKIEEQCISYFGDSNFNDSSGGFLFSNCRNSEEKIEKLLVELKEENIVQADELENIVIIREEDTRATKALIHDKLVAGEGYEPQDGLSTMLAQKRNLLINGHVHVFLVHSCGHWLPFRFEFVSDTGNGVRVWTADSINQDPTRVDCIERIVALMDMEIV